MFVYRHVPFTHALELKQPILPYATLYASCRPLQVPSDYNRTPQNFKPDDENRYTLRKFVFVGQDVTQCPA